MKEENHGEERIDGYQSYISSDTMSIMAMRTHQQGEEAMNIQERFIEQDERKSKVLCYSMNQVVTDKRV